MKPRTAKVGMIAQEEPPETARGASVHRELVALVPQLRAERGSWFRIAEFTNTSGASAQARKLREKYPNQIETRSANTGSGSALWARWTGSRTNGTTP